jgi:hypothetical protein
MALVQARTLSCSASAVPWRDGCTGPAAPRTAAGGCGGGQRRRSAARERPPAPARPATAAVCVAASAALCSAAVGAGEQRGGAPSSLPAPRLQQRASVVGREEHACRRPQQLQIPTQDAGEPDRVEQSAGPWPGSLHIEPAPERLVPEVAASPLQPEPDEEAEQPVSEVRLRRGTSARGQRGARCPAASAACCACDDLAEVGRRDSTVLAVVRAQAGGGEPEGGPAAGDDAQSLAGASAGEDPALAGAAQAPAARARSARAGTSPAFAAPENKHKLVWLFNHYSRQPGAHLGGAPVCALL